MIVYRIHVGFRDVATVVYIWIIRAYHFPSIQNSFQITLKSQRLHTWVDIYVRAHVLPLT